jgi:hypothetical protein
MEPVRPTTVIVNNTTVINQTVNITKVQVVNNRVINEGPRPDTIERKSGHKIQAIPVHELRHKEETEVASRERINRAAEKRGEPAGRAETASPQTVPARELRPAVTPPEVAKQAPPTATRNEVRQPVEQRPTPPGAERGARNEDKRATENGGGRPVTTPGETRARPETKPTPPAARQTGKPAEAKKQPQQPVRGPGEASTPGTPARPQGARQLGNERQRELERQKDKRETPAVARKPVQQPTSKQVGKTNAPAKAKPAPGKGSDATKKKKKDDKKKGEESDTPQPTTPPRSPQ